mgnify:CR=1 FL=1
MIRIEKSYFKRNGMTLPELTIAMLVLVIFFGVLSFYSQYFQKNIKSENTLDSNKKTWIENENNIYISMRRWAEILSQPSISKEEILKINCRYKPKKEVSIWGLPGKVDENIPSSYKYCVYPTLLSESNLEDLIEKRQNANPGIYFIYAIPENPSATKKPIRTLFCRPITFC